MMKPNVVYVALSLSLLVFIFVVAILGVAALSARRHSLFESTLDCPKVSEDCQLDQSYAQGAPVESEAVEHIDCEWTYDKGSYQDSEISFVLEIQGTSSASVTDGSTLDWANPIVTRTLSSSGNYQYSRNGTNYRYTLSDQATLDNLQTSMYYWTRIQVLGPPTESIHSDWDYTTTSFVVIRCDPIDCDPGLTYCDSPNCKSCACQCGSGNKPDPSCNDCTSCDATPNVLYQNDPISQAVYYGFCRYADNVSLCMSESSRRYQNAGSMGVFPENLPNSSCVQQSPTLATRSRCSPPCPPFSARVKSPDGKTDYASCVTPYGPVDPDTQFNPVKMEQVYFDDWTSPTNAYDNGFIWTIDGDINTCIVPMKHASGQSNPSVVQRKILSGHPYLVWQTRYGADGGSYLIFTSGSGGTNYPIFRLFHPSTKSVVSNKKVHAPNSGDCGNSKLTVTRIDNPETYNFYCKYTGDNANDEKCYLFSMWNTCGELDKDSNKLGGGPGDQGNPIDSCYKVWNMPVKNSYHRQMTVKTPGLWANSSNPDTCIKGQSPGYFKAVAISGTTAGDSSASFDFYANANLSWPPTSSTTPWVQPLQFCIPMSVGSETYSNCSLYMYTFANTDSSNPSSFETIGWIYDHGAEGSVQSWITYPPGNPTDTSLQTTYHSEGDYSFVFSYIGLEAWGFLVGDEYTPAMDPLYNNIDGRANVYVATYGVGPPTINITDTGALRTQINGVTYYFCTYARENTRIRLWINFDGDFTFDSSVTIRCPMLAVYYES